jgi:hypothetical protein
LVAAHRPSLSTTAVIEVDVTTSVDSHMLTRSTLANIKDDASCDAQPTT